MNIGQALRTCHRWWIAPLCVILVVSTAVTALAADSGVSVELNKLEPQDAACRAYFVLENRSPIAFSTLKLDLVMFDNDGIVTRLLAAELGPLPLEKTSLKVFDMEELPCTGLGRLLLNDVTGLRRRLGTPRRLSGPAFGEHSGAGAFHQVNRPSSVAAEDMDTRRRRRAAGARTTADGRLRSEEGTKASHALPHSHASAALVAK